MWPRERFKGMRVKDDRNISKIPKSKDPCVGIYKAEEAMVKT
jgi:hypothetical protein